MVLPPQRHQPQRPRVSSRRSTASPQRQLHQHLQPSPARVTSDTKVGTISEVRGATWENTRSGTSSPSRRYQGAVATYQQAGQHRRDGQRQHHQFSPWTRGRRYAARRTRLHSAHRLQQRHDVRPHHLIVQPRDPVIAEILTKIRGLTKADVLAEE